MARYDDDLKVGKNHGDLTVGQLRKRLVTARANSPAVGRMNPNYLAAIRSPEANLARSESVRDYWQSDRSAGHREKVREALQANRKLSRGRAFSDEWREAQAASMAFGGAAKALDARWGPSRADRDERNQGILRCCFIYRMAKVEIAAIFCLSLPRVQRICATVRLDLDL
jgi:hypothetical protein